MTEILFAAFALGFAVRVLTGRGCKAPDRRIGRLGLPPGDTRLTDEDCWPWEDPTR